MIGPGDTTDPRTARRDEGPHDRPARYVTADIPGVGGVIKRRPEDFLVEEIPAYEPSGQGEHVYLFVEKRSLSTLELVRIVARHFGVRERDVGYAGLKDKAAVTRQMLSIHVPGRRPEDFPALEHERVRVLWVDRHANKLRRGHLRGNRFSIKVRGVALESVRHADATLRALARAGVPNRFGEQRFGALGRNHLIGRAMVRGDPQEACDLLLGPGPAGESDDARAMYARGDFAGARDAFPRWCDAERRVAGALARGLDHARAFAALPFPERSYFASALQSALFNRVLDDRVQRGTLASLVPGDLAFRHDNGAVFAVDDGLAAEAETRRRLSAFEISPSGPMWGAAMTRAAGDVDRAEREALASMGLTPEALIAFDRAHGGLVEGARRPLRVPVIDPVVEGGADEHGVYVRCAFDLPRGAFATVVLREVMKPPPEETPPEETPPDESPVEEER